ncbi:MAG: hypothetical protein AB7P69_22235 [Candidatus Binatia bacterium]
MGRMVIVLAVLIVAAEATAWGQKNEIGQKPDVTSREVDCGVIQLVSDDAVPLATSTLIKDDETTLSTEPAAPVEPAGEENEVKPDAAPQSPLDLDALEERIRRTDALGFFTKLSLKNKVEDLLNWFHAYHTGKSDLTIEQLRERYNLLLLKLVSLLEDGDALLSRDILTSRGAIWNVLADPKQFAKLQEN